MSRYEWMAHAVCAQVDPDLFHPEGKAPGRDAKNVCTRCPVQRQCADHVARLEGDDSSRSRHGLWAGHSPRQRVASSNHITRETNRESILRLAARGGLDAYQIADLVGCDVRTVWRTLKNHRDQLGEAA